MRFIAMVVLTAGAVLLLSPNEAEARSYGYGSGSKYSMYGFSGRGSSNYEMYGYRSHGSSYNRGSYYRGSYGRGGSGRYWHQGRSHQRYNDPTGKTIVKIGSDRLPLPAGNFGRATNRVRVSY